MAFEARYIEQVRLLIAVLSFVAREKDFALKGGTAINLFVRDMPRLSVDIDLTYLPVEDRDTSLRNAEVALRRMAESIHLGSPNPDILYSPKKPLTRFDVRLGGTVKIEVNPVLRGCLFPPERRTVMPSVEEQFGFAEVPVVSFADLYAGKICAALDRQHPRDWFDVKLLLDNEGITRPLMQALLVYLSSGDRPIHELLSGRWQNLKATFANHFVGMTRTPLELAELEATRDRLLDEIAINLTAADSAFLLSIKRAEPRWELLGLPAAERLPALQWKLLNLRKMAPKKHAEAVGHLESALERLKRRRDVSRAG